MLVARDKAHVAHGAHPGAHLARMGHRADSGVYLSCIRGPHATASLITRNEYKNIFDPSTLVSLGHRADFGRHLSCMHGPHATATLINMHECQHIFCPSTLDNAELYSYLIAVARTLRLGVCLGQRMQR